MKVCFFNIGCKVNFAEITQIASQFVARNWQEVQFYEPSDVVLIHTCTVTKNADADSRKFIRKAIEFYPNAFIAVLGCYAQLNSEQLKNFDGVDAIFGNTEKFKIFELIDGFYKRESPEVFVSEIPTINDFEYASSKDSELHTRINVKIQDGCDYHCSYCTIPAARGKSRSMKFDDLKIELSKLVEQNYREIVLSGINLGEYCSESGEKFFDVLKFISESNFNSRFRISSIEPNLLTTEMIDLIADSNNICHHFHIPLQSGSDRILGLMARRYRAVVFENIVNYINNKIPNACIGLDLIAGFPGETDTDFNDTLKLLKNLKFTYIHPFGFSERKDAKISKSDNLPKNIIKARIKALQELSAEKKNDFYNSQIGRIQRIIPEKFNPQQQIWSATTDNYIRVKFHFLNELSKDFYLVKLLENCKTHISAEIINNIFK